MSDPHRAAPAPTEVTVYGAATCEDTAITRSRLRALGVPFREIDIDADPGGLARVIELEGRRVTPTVVIGTGRSVVAEPSIEQLEQLIRAAGIELAPPSARQIRDPLADRAIPLRTVPDVNGSEFSLEAILGRQAGVLFFAHDATCLACYGYAKQLARQADAMRDADGYAVIISRDTPDSVRRWTAELPVGAVLLGDQEGAWTHAVQAALSLAPSTVVLLVVDRYAAPRAVSAAAEAGGLIGPAEATDWLRFLALECPECGNDVSWPD